MASCIAKGLQNNIIVFPELISGDEGVTGKKGDRPSLETLKAWISAKLMSVIIFFSITRCSRSLYKGLKFIKEDVDECGIRALAIFEDIAQQIAILVVRQHRRLQAQDGKKEGRSALY